MTSQTDRKRIADLEERIKDLESDRKELCDALDTWRQGHESAQEMLRAAQERAAEAEIKAEELESALAKEKARADELWEAWKRWMQERSDG